MPNAQWEKIEEVFNQAILLPEEERDAFITEKCGRDPFLFSQVSSLLSADKQSDQLFEESLFPLVAGLLDDDYRDLLKNCSFASYNLKKLLGRGGMGAVFLAEDTRLERFVALKVLSRAFDGNLESLLRFEQEAKAVSAISHPNIAHIYEYGFHNGMYYFAMEYVPGKTLRELLKEKKIDLPLALEITIQIAHALDAAHQEHITHRDIKPENIIIREQGSRFAPVLVKVLDFGLAKLGENHPRRKRSDSSSFETIPGLIMGTAAYMSPEQIRSQPVDERTDLWSLGVVLYEMLSGGKRPFEGETPSDIQAAILLKEPPLLSLAKKHFPLKKIINKTLAKEPEKRYRSAADCFFDLQNLKHRLFPQKKHAPENSYHFSGLPANQRPFWLLLAAGLFFLSIIVFVSLFLPRVINPFGKRAQTQMTIRQASRINNSGKAIRAALSPSGKQLALVIEESGRQALFLRPASGETDFSEPAARQLLPPSEQKYTGVVFSPDERNIYFTSTPSESDASSLFRVSLNERLDAGQNPPPQLPPAPQKLLDDIQNAPGVSSDGRQFVFLRTSDDNSHEEIWTANSDGTNQRLLYQREMPDFIPHQTTPVFSPDGRKIIFAAGTYHENQTEVRPAALDLETKQLTPVLKEPWKEIWQMSWLSDGRGFVLAGRPDRTRDNKQLYFVSYPEGKAVPITRDFNDYFGVSVAPADKDEASGFQIASVILNRQAPMWEIDLENPNQPPQQLTETGNDSLGITWTRNGIFYGSMAQGNADIWLFDPDKKWKRQLTFDSHTDLNPAAAATAADPRYIVFSSDRTGVTALWRMRPDGSEQKLLVPQASPDSFTVSPDGKTVYFYSYYQGRGALWQIRVDLNPSAAGAAQKLLEGEYAFPSASPDNKLMAATFVEPATREKKIAVWEIKDPPGTIRFLQPAAGAQLPGVLRWAGDCKSIIYIVNKKGVGNLWVQPVLGAGGGRRDGISMGKQLTNFTGSRIFYFDYSPDRRRIVVARGEITGQAALLSVDLENK